jgi:hypothetical protein
MENNELYFYDNPVVNNTQLAKSAIEYRFSSANFYENSVDDFGL